MIIRGVARDRQRQRHQLNPGFQVAIGNAWLATIAGAMALGSGALVLDHWA